MRAAASGLGVAVEELPGGFLRLRHADAVSLAFGTNFAFEPLVPYFACGVKALSARLAERGLPVPESRCFAGTQYADAVSRWAPGERTPRSARRRDLHSRAVDADLRLLRYFVAVAEELHFTRAAARLHIAQQPLSAAIQRFEADLGVALFRRTTRRVELTAAGDALLEPARIALRAADDALAAARAAGRGIAGDLQFGLSSGARYGLEPLFAALAERHPALTLHIRHDSAAPMIDAVRHGRLDLAVTFGAQIPDDLEHHRLKDEPAVLAVAATHPVADREAVALIELRDETFALDVPGYNPDYDHAVIEACRRSGFEPRTRVSSASHDAWEGAVHREGCVGLTVRTAVQATHRDLRLLQLREPFSFPLDLIWRNTSGPLRPVLAAAISTALDVRDGQHWHRAGEPADGAART